MKDRNKIQEEIEKTLQSLDNVKRAQANPFLFTRIKAKMEEAQNGWSRLAGFISRPAFAIGIVCFVLLINAWILYSGSGSDAASGQVQQVFSENSDEYNLAVNTFYDYETP
ncbi:MAG: hypothetical protein HC867_02710 [Bacteroidia bacterium]|nr:hypothetical protein [Bacteroidia bacterium]